jgi:Mrp family chromosome partitioning ATPase
MTALDQAFIRAFSQQGMPPAVPPRRSADDRLHSRLDEQESGSRNAAGREAESQPTAVASPAAVASPQISDVFRDVLATLERPPLRPASLEKRQASTADNPWSPVVEAGSGAWSNDWCQSSVGIAEPLTFAQPIVLAESVGLIEPPFAIDTSDRGPAVGDQPSAVSDRQSAISDRQSAINDRQSAINDQQSAINDQQSPVTHLSSFPQVPLSQEQPAPSEFKPAWQVERFTWPRVCRRLMARAAEEFDRLADALLAANARGQKVLAMAACCRGEGATTLLLCAARRLAERGVKLVLVDADLSRPRLAKRLGVSLQSGWNEKPDQDATFLSNAVIEAAANNLALSAIREPTGEQARGDCSRLASCLDTLKGHYEMVLVDLGPLENIESLDDYFRQTIDGKIDGVLLVHNPRITSEARLADVEEQLTAANVALAGLIENFVAS